MYDRSFFEIFTSTGEQMMHKLRHTIKFVVDSSRSSYGRAGGHVEVIQLDDDDEYSHRKTKRDDNDSKPKTAADIQKEMTKWARRQEKVKMSFKPADASSSVVPQQAASTVIQPSQRLADKKPWADADEEEDEATQFAGEPPIALPTGRVRNAALPLNYQPSRHVTGNVSNEAAIGHAQPSREPAGLSVGGPPAPFDEEQFLDRSKATCLLCRRQFANSDALNKHVQLSDLHKTNLATKRKEFHQQSLSTAQRSSLDTTLQYRDRARERRQMHGYDSAGPSNEGTDYSDPKMAEELASMKAKVPLDESNIGNRMLKSMGWSEGQGLGRNAQGIVNPLVADQRVQGVGLGATGSKVAYGTSRRERMQQSVIQRFNDLQD